MSTVQSSLNKRLWCKTTPTSTTQPRVQQGPTNPLVLELLGADGLPALPGDARRNCIHWTMARVHKPGAVQPSQMTRKQFWKHLGLCYLEAYPDATSDTKSFLQFGIVAKEEHNNAEREEDRSIHIHCASFSIEKHYWKRIRDIGQEVQHPLECRGPKPAPLRVRGLYFRKMNVVSVLGEHVRLYLSVFVALPGVRCL